MSIAPSQYEYLRQLIKQSSAIIFDEDNKYVVESRLAKLSMQEGFPSVSHLIDHLRNSPRLHRKVMDAITNNESWFFRDQYPFDGMRNVIIPDLLKRRSDVRKLVIWSAACSTGQEPYSVAMLVREHFPELLQWDLRILATDLSAAALSRAEQGRFSRIEVSRGLPGHLLARYFSRQGTDWQISRELRSMIAFKPINLAQTWADVSAIDILLLRNVLIYFDLETKRAILGRAHHALCRDGYMLLGSAETTLNITDAFERVEIERASWYRLR